jgi:hypothetical protein
MARSLFGDGRTLVVDVQHAAHPDLRAYRRGLHKAVLLDEMASPEFIVTNKKLLQAHVDGAILGQSSTQLFTYELFLWRTPLMITTNNFDYSAFSAADKDWLESNCVAVYVGQPVWEGAPQQRPSATTPAAEPRVKRPVSALTPQPSPEHKLHAGSCAMCGQRVPPERL